MNKNIINKKILNDAYNSIVLNLSKNSEIYLVGGFLRDLILNKKSNDRDYLLRNDINSFSILLKEKIGGTIIKFNKGNITRLALNNNITLDFQPLKENLKENLYKRDFTINSLAWSPDKGIIDYFNCIDDIQKRKIKCISEKNIKDDPLRIIRAYRFASHIRGKIERKTRNIIKKYKYLLKKVAIERITSEFFNLLNSDNPYIYLKMAYDDGILQYILHINNNNFKKNIKDILRIQKYLFNYKNNKLKLLLNKNYSQNLKYKGLLFLETLLKDLNCKNLNNINLLLSKKINKRLKEFNEGNIFLKNNNIKNKEKLFDFFIKSKEAALDLIIIYKKLYLIKELKKFNKCMKSKLLNNEIIEKLKQSYQGKILGNIINNIRKKIFTGNIKSKKQMLKYINNILHNIHYQT